MPDIKRPADFVPCPVFSDADTACTRNHSHPLPHRGENGSEWVPYDPDYDSCAFSPGCGNERVHFESNGLRLTACPSCYTVIHGTAPDPSIVHKIAPESIPGLEAAP